jgi:GTPase
MFITGPENESFQSKRNSLLMQSEANGKPQSLPQEVEEGNVEYKFMLINPTTTRLEHLISQMKWRFGTCLQRLAEGSGEALYEIGVSDSGILVGLSLIDLTNSIDTLRKMGKCLFADVTIIKSLEVENGRHVAEILVQKLNEINNYQETKIAVVGSHGSGSILNSHARVFIHWCAHT